MAEQRISFIDPDSITDEAMIAEFERCARVRSQHQGIVQSLRVAFCEMRILR